VWLYLEDCFHSLPISTSANILASQKLPQIYERSLEDYRVQSEQADHGKGAASSIQGNNVLGKRKRSQEGEMSVLSQLLLAYTKFLESLHNQATVPTRHEDRAGRERLKASMRLEEAQAARLLHQWLICIESSLDGILSQISIRPYGLPSDLIKPILAFSPGNDHILSMVCRQ
jgi:hypothetical protein